MRPASQSLIMELPLHSAVAALHLHYRNTNKRIRECLYELNSYSEILTLSAHNPFGESK